MLLQILRILNRQITFSLKQITKLFSTLKETFSYIIVDAEPSFDGKNIAALDCSDLILLVTVANLPALRNTQKMS